MSKSLFKNVIEKIPRDIRLFTRYAGELAIAVGELRERQGLTQRDLAERIDMKESQLSRILGGSGNPTLQTIARLAAVLGEDLIEFPAYKQWEHNSQSSYQVSTIEAHSVVLSPSASEATLYTFYSSESTASDSPEDRLPMKDYSIAA